MEVIAPPWRRQRQACQGAVDANRAPRCRAAAAGSRPHAVFAQGETPARQHPALIVQSHHGPGQHHLAHRQADPRALTHTPIRLKARALVEHPKHSPSSGVLRRMDPADSTGAAEVPGSIP